MKNHLSHFFLTFFCAIIFSLHLNAQEGSPFLTNYSVSDESMADNYSLCQDKDGVLVVANRKGLLIFDADEWKIVKTPDLPLVVAFDNITQSVYVGCRNHAGYISRNKKGEYEFIAVAVTNPGLVTQIIFIEKSVYFVSQTAVSVVASDEKKVLYTVENKEFGVFLFAMPFKNQLFVDIENKGLHILNGKQFSLAVKNFPLAGKLVFYTDYDSLQLLLGSTDNKCYVFNGSVVKSLVLQDQQYLSDGIITDAKTIGRNKLAISTSNSGCLVIDKQSGKTLYSVNYENGLPDDEILAMCAVEGEGIWLAHYLGLSRVDAGIPVKNYSNFKGLIGKSQVVEFYNNKIFIGTSNGIYYLDKRKDYIEFLPKENTINNEMPALTAITPILMEETTPLKKSEEHVSASQKEKKGFLSRLFKRKKDEPRHDEPEKAITQEIVKDEKPSGIISFVQSSAPVKEKPASTKKSYRIASVKYQYNKVPGFEYKCRQMAVVDNKLVAMTISGIYEITESRAIPILSDVSANYISLIESDKKLYICCDDGIKIISFSGQKWKVQKFAEELNEPVYSFAKDVFDNYWIGGESKVTKLKLKPDKSIKEKKEYKFESEFRERVFVRISDKKPIFFLSSGIYSIFNDSIQKHRWLSRYSGDESQIYFSNSDYTWIQKRNDWVLLKSNEPADTSGSEFLNLFTKISHVYLDKNNNVWVVEGNSSIYKVNLEQIDQYKSNFNAFVKRFTGVAGDLDLNNIVLSNQENSIKIRISAPYFLKENSNQYQIFVNGFYKDWSEWSTNPEFTSVLPPGRWEIKVRARNVFGNVSEEKTLNVYVKGPFYFSWWFIIICIAALIGAVIQIIKYRERALRQEKEILENKVRERTRQIEEQKEEIEAQRDDLVDKNIQITAQKEEIEKQKNKITLQNLEITDSIRYAKRLQAAVMPDEKVLNSLLKNYFVLFKPKDIVSGDFFWVKMKNDKIIIAAADCTGHGVPGGFLSMLGVSFLNEISAIDKEIAAHEILNILKSRVKSTLIKEGNEDQSKDGMDICLLVYDPKTRKAQFAGANNPLYLIRNNGIIEYTADKMPIGAYVAEKESFSLNEFEALPGDTFYLFSDGFRDQIGGVAEKRVKSKGFKSLLLEIQKYPMAKQKEKLESFFEEWKGKNDQMDDILVIGVRI